VIRVEDNFFDEKMFTYIRRHVTTKLVFEPRYLDYTEIAKENFNGWRFKWVKDKDLLAIFTKQAEKTFRLNIKQLANEGEDPTGGVDLRMLDRFKPHTDIEEGSKLNILVMLAGPTAVTNGTVFYTDDQLDTHVGFRENRAIMFPSNKVHSGHVSVVPNLRRYTASIFVKDYELV
jgi:hypothetical protein|tara:strand:+ start:369 stop:893 length:525 start_codon:yes stop_codon:yes gene_type:complete